jgi:Na+/H+ antiporter NhaD/arsenite permease-like protein
MQPASSAPLGLALPLWAVAPFALMLLSIAVLPLLAGRFWQRNRNKALVALMLGGPVAWWLGWLQPAVLLRTAHEYAAFLILLGALFVISGGIVVRGTLSGKPGLNTALLAIGAVLASVIGTTGASMLLIRPLLRANSVRTRKAHVIVFFIFIVSNAGGLLTPLGDPPLFLGFLRGVPFLWTLRLLPHWLFVNGLLLGIGYLVDAVLFRREEQETAGAVDKRAEQHEVPIHLAGTINLLWLASVLGLLLVSGSAALPPGVLEGGLALLALGSWLSTPRVLREENAFGWGPIVEVAVVFAGIFATMIPALEILNARGAELGTTEPWQFFWASGALSSFLDNAPTYLTFAATASGVVGADATNLATLLQTPHGAALLAAVSAGSVLMGANSYIGNGPNFMVRSIAEGSGVRMPSFFGYMAWSGGILIPIFLAVTWIFF